MKTARTACFFKKIIPCKLPNNDMAIYSSFSFTSSNVSCYIVLRIINVISRVHHLGHLAHRFRYVDKTFKVCCQFFNGCVIFVRKGVECLLRTR